MKMRIREFYIHPSRKEDRYVLCRFRGWKEFWIISLVFLWVALPVAIYERISDGLPILVGCFYEFWDSYSSWEEALDAVTAIQKSRRVSEGEKGTWI